MAQLVNKETGEGKTFNHISPFARKSVALKCGNMIVQNYGPKYNEKTHEMDLVETDKVNLQEYIDSFKDETGVYNILKKYSKTGDASLLNQREGFYGDISGLPVDQLNPQKMAKAAKASAESLSKKLGVEITTEQLASMSSNELNDLISKAVAAKLEAEKVKVVETKKEGE